MTEELLPLDKRTQAREGRPEPRRIKPRSAKAKGSRLERDVAKALGGKRTPLSGAVGGGDVIAEGFSIECKARAEIPALLRNAFQQADKDIVTGDTRRSLVVIKADRAEPIYCVRESTFLELLNAKAGENMFGIRELFRAIQKLAVQGEEKCR
jgi:hypothetical protein